MFNITALLVGQDEWRSVPLVATVILCRCGRRAVAYMGQQPETRGFHSYTLPHNCDLHSECARYIHLHSGSDSETALPWNSVDLPVEIWPSWETVFYLQTGRRKKIQKARSWKNKKKCLVFILAQGCTIPRYRVAVATTYLHGGHRYLCVLSVERASRRLSGTDNFDATPILTENLYILDLVPLLIIQ